MIALVCATTLGDVPSLSIAIDETFFRTAQLQKCDRAIAILSLRGPG